MNDRGVPEAELAYIAGFFDGEGCISAVADRRGYVSVRLNISQKFDIPLLFIQARFGGNIRWHRGTVWHWEAYGDAALNMLRALLPYLMLKRPQAELAIEFLAARNGPGQHYTPGQRKRRLALATEISALKREG
jgi:hypothetical protein